MNALTCEFSRGSRPFFPLLLTPGRLSKKQTFSVQGPEKEIWLAGIRYHPWSKLLHPAHSWNTSARADQQHLCRGDQLHTTALVQRTGINWHLLFLSLPLGASLWVTDSLPGYVWWIEMQEKGSFERSLGVWWGDQTWSSGSALFLESTWVFLYDSTWTLVEFTRTQLILQ